MAACGGNSGDWFGHRLIRVIAIAVLLAANCGPALADDSVEQNEEQPVPRVDQKSATEPAVGERARASKTVAQPLDLNPRPLGTARTPTQKTAAAAQGHSGEASPQTTRAGWWSNPILRTLASLGTVLSVIGVLAVVARKLKAKGLLAHAPGGSGGAPAGILEVLGRYPIARGQTLMLLKVDQRILLIGQTLPKLRGGAGSMQTLCEISAPEEVASILIKAQDNAGASASAKFQAMLRDFDAQHLEDDDAPAASNTSKGRPRQTDSEHRSDRRADDQPNLRFPHVDPLADARTVERRPAPAEAPAHRAAASEAYSAAASGASTSNDSYHQIRDRLSALRGEAHR
jgi:flagellar biogenesis protein FliO